MVDVREGIPGHHYWWVHPDKESQAASDDSVRPFPKF
jgi:hypothetical protein